MKGDDEPIYYPADENRTYHVLYFAHGYFSSALHECAHWFIAGPERRQLVDFGYWYEPDGRSAEQQSLFQQFEVKPQALEWILSVAAGYRFHISIDNLSGQACDTAAFKEAVFQQVITYCETGLPKRAHLFRQRLCAYYATFQDLQKSHYAQEDLS
jgi:elongation factor P hydroxylase